MSGILDESGSRAIVALSHSTALFRRAGAAPIGHGLPRRVVIQIIHDPPVAVPCVARRRFPILSGAPSEHFQERNTFYLTCSEASDTPSA